jgi:hypothetical protein
MGRGRALVSRGAALVAALPAVLAAVGCGGSVADVDAPDPTRAEAPRSSPFCAAAEANTEAIRPLNALVAGGQVPRDELADTVDAVRRAGADMVNTAPPEIQADVEQTVAMLSLQLDVLMANDGDPSAVARDPQVAARLNSPEVTGAAQRLRSYVERTCGASTTPR